MKSDATLSLRTYITGKQTVLAGANEPPASGSSGDGVLADGDWYAREVRRLDPVQGDNVHNTHTHGPRQAGRG